MKKIQKKQLKEGTKPKDESQEESENESKISVKIKDENSSELCERAKNSQKILEENFKKNLLPRPLFFFLFFFASLLLEPAQKGLFNKHKRFLLKEKGSKDSLKIEVEDFFRN